MKKILFTIVLGAVCFFGHTQKIAWVDTITVDATRLPLPIDQTGRSIAIVNKDQIDLIPATSIDELFQYIPGIEVQSRFAFGVQGDISMRGSTFTQVLVLLDGMKVNDPLTGHFNSNLPVTISEIERIEILRGAAAAIYGADAVGGVINIITKSFTHSSKKRQTINAHIHLGEHKLIETEIGFSHVGEKVSISGGLHSAKSDGEEIPSKTINGSDLDAFNTFFDIQSGGLSVGYVFNPSWKLNFRSAYDSRNFNARYFYTTSTFDKSTETVKNWWNQLKLTKIGDSSSTDINMAYKYATDEFIFSPDFPSTNNHVTQFYNFQINHLYQFSDNVLIKGGAQLDRRQIESNDRGNHEDDHAGIYIMGAYVPSDKLSIQLSNRLDFDGNYGTAYIPQLNVSYKISQLGLRASVGKSIRAADYTERFVSTNLANLTPGRSLGKPDLSAEESWSYELGADIQLTKNIGLQGTYFLRKSSELIDYALTNSNDILLNQNLAPGEDYFLASNVSEVSTGGFEVNTMLTKKLGEYSFNASLGYTYLTSSNEEEVISVYISSHAKHLLNTYANLNHEHWSLGISTLYKSREARMAEAIGHNLNASYFLMNANLTHMIVKGVDLSFRVHNLLDVTYQDILGAPMPGRWLSGGLKVSL